MRNFAFLFAFSLVFTACQTKFSKDDVAKINGYWQIEKVVKNDGEHKDYQANTVYDFYEIKSDKGYRAKVMPQLDGTFQTNDLTEKIVVTYEKDGTFLNYMTDYDKWREKIISISDAELVVENPQQIEYHYKKAGPIKLD
ncbi:lipocalin family protein [Flavobacterium sp.]|uniref:lipocalin family protein n=1 Tax=Flavobacterium sp. TaxID=239 RepID=UPI0011F41FE8|nr:lipocalin family protein [Flavobacterium sp.]RZJ71240.1 MAG: hypothetical protein EOO49_10855 [Flavobacterium sp.]